MGKRNVSVTIRHVIGDWTAVVTLVTRWLGRAGAVRPQIHDRESKIRHCVLKLNTFMAKVFDILVENGF